MTPKVTPLLGCFDFYYFKEGNLTRFQRRKSAYIFNYLQTILFNAISDLECRRGEDTPWIFTNPIATPIHPLIPYKNWLHINFCQFSFVGESITKSVTKNSLTTIIPILIQNLYIFFLTNLRWCAIFCKNLGDYLIMW